MSVVVFSSKLLVCKHCCCCCTFSTTQRTYYYLYVPTNCCRVEQTLPNVLPFLPAKKRKPWPNRSRNSVLLGLASLARISPSSNLAGRWIAWHVFQQCIPPDMKSGCTNVDARLKSTGQISTQFEKSYLLVETTHYGVRTYVRTYAGGTNSNWLARL